ncbi:uncharacterized protein LOC144747059 [Ciona intestinalis]
MTCSPPNPVRHEDDDRLKWLTHTFLPTLLSWKEEVSTIHKGENKRIIASPTLEGIVFTTRNFIEIAKQLLRESSLEYVALNVFTQDIWESFIEKHLPICHHPDLVQAAYGIQHIRVRKGIKES